MWEIAICDDNGTHSRRAMQMLQEYAAGTGEDVHIELFEDVDECVAESGRFNAVFMDIEFDNSPLGIEAVARINEASPGCQVVYLTNYLHYSLDVYDTDHAWYVLKSQLEQRIPEIMRKLKAIQERRRATIVIKPVGEASYVTLLSEEICCLERSHRVTRITLRDGASYETRDKISELLAKLPESSFARCHNSYVVNMEHLKRVRSTELDLADDRLVPVSRQYSKPFRAKYMAWIEERTV